MLYYLAVGLDPEKVKFVVQSMGPGADRADDLLHEPGPHRDVRRNPTLKEEIKQEEFHQGITGRLLHLSDLAGFGHYDFQSTPGAGRRRPAPMIEQAREIVRRFNRMYDKVLVEPKALVGEVARLPGTDGGAKMSKSLGNCIYLGDSSEVVRKRVMSMYTDPTACIRPIPATSRATRSSLITTVSIRQSRGRGIKGALSQRHGR